MRRCWQAEGPTAAVIALGNHILSGTLRAMHAAGLTMGPDMSVVAIGMVADWWRSEERSFPD